MVVVEGLWTFLGLSQPNLLKPLTAWGAGAFADLGGLPLFLLGLLGTWVGGTGVIMLVAAVALEALLGSLGFFLLGKVKPEKSTGAPLYILQEVNLNIIFWRTAIEVLVVAFLA